MSSAGMHGQLTVISVSLRLSKNGATTHSPGSRLAGDGHGKMQLANSALHTLQVVSSPMRRAGVGEEVLALAVPVGGLAYYLRHRDWHDGSEDHVASKQPCLLANVIRNLTLSNIAVLTLERVRRIFLGSETLVTPCTAVTILVAQVVTLGCGPAA